MKVKFHYGEGVLNLPSDVLNVISRADEDALRVLLHLAAGGNPTREKLAQLCGCSAAAVDTALAFWRGAGVIEIDGGRSAAKGKQTADVVEPTQTGAAAESTEPQQQSRSTRRVLPEGGLPNYTTEELATLLESRRELAALIDECSQVFGKIFNAHEVSRLLGLVDYLGLSGEYLLLLLAHCVKMGKKSLRYVESVAIALYDDGVTDVSALQQCLKMREQREESEGKIRAMFGISSRSLTSKERRMIDAWLFEHKVDVEVVRLAYERTVDAIGKASIPYANSIIERWASEKLLTSEAILAAEAAHAKQNATQPTPGNSFDTNDFFDAALQRSFGEDYVPAGDQN